MTIHNDITNYQPHNQQDTYVPMFMPANMEQPMADNATTQETKEDVLSLFDVKEIYDRAYEEKAKGEEGTEAFKKLLAEAVKLDMAYRRQLAKTISYKDKKQMKTFKTASGNARVA